MEPLPYIWEVPTLIWTQSVTNLTVCNGFSSVLWGICQIMPQPLLHSFSSSIIPVLRYYRVWGSDSNHQIISEWIQNHHDATNFKGIMEVLCIAKRRDGAYWRNRSCWNINSNAYLFVMSVTILYSGSLMWIIFHIFNLFLTRFGRCNVYWNTRHPVVWQSECHKTVLNNFNILCAFLKSW